MSVNLAVYLKRENLPTRNRWQREIDAEGIRMLMDDVDATSHTGFWPMTLNEKDCGFEYCFGPIESSETDNELDEFEEALGDRDHIVNFKWHSSLDDGQAASLAAAVLAKIANGVFLDPQSGEFAIGASAFDLLSRQNQAERERKMQDAIRRSAHATQRRCPKCGTPCPEFRPTCKVCGFAIGRV